MFTIKRAAELTGVPEHTLRAWERRYGLVQPSRTASGYRLYDEEAVSLITAMKELVGAGWSAREAAAEAARRAHAADPGPVVGDDLVPAAADLDGEAIGRLLDAEFAKTTEFGRPLVNSIFTLGLVIGMTVGETTLGTTIANLGMSKVEFPKPVFHGDTIRARSIVRGLRASRSRPEAGVVEFEHQGINQRGEIVATCLRAAFMKRRAAP